MWPSIDFPTFSATMRRGGEGERCLYIEMNISSLREKWHKTAAKTTYLMETSNVITFLKYRICISQITMKTKKQTNKRSLNWWSWYIYFGTAINGLVIKLLGKQQETRTLWVGYNVARSIGMVLGLTTLKIFQLKKLLTQDISLGKIASI